MNDSAVRAPRSGRGGFGRSAYNEKGERIDQIMRRQGRRFSWLLRKLEESEHPVSRQTFYRARLPENDRLYINVDDNLWIAVAKILGVHPSEIMGTRREEAA